MISNGEPNITQGDKSLSPGRGTLKITFVRRGVGVVKLLTDSVVSLGACS